MAFSIDTTSWRKDTRLPPGKGWGGVRPGGILPTSIVIHTTDNSHATAFDGEAAFLRDSPDVSAHFLVGKIGQIAQILPPELEAWHAGVAIPAYGNDFSIGIEAHVSVGEQWTPTQRDALTWLVRLLLDRYHIQPQHVDTHRAIALPKGRKADPLAFPDAAFYAWRAQLITAPAPQRYAYTPTLPIYQASTLTGPLAGQLRPGDVVLIDARAPLPGYAPTAAHLADGRGFVDLSKLEAV